MAKNNALNKFAALKNKAADIEGQTLGNKKNVIPEPMDKNVEKENPTVYKPPKSESKEKEVPKIKEKKLTTSLILDPKNYQIIKLHSMISKKSISEIFDEMMKNYIKQHQLEKYKNL